MRCTSCTRTASSRAFRNTSKVNCWARTLHAHTSHRWSFNSSRKYWTSSNLANTWLMCIIHRLCFQDFRRPPAHQKPQQIPRSEYTTIRWSALTAKSRSWMRFSSHQLHLLLLRAGQIKPPALPLLLRVQPNQTTWRCWLLWMYWSHVTQRIHRLTVNLLLMKHHQGETQKTGCWWVLCGTSVM